MGIILAYFSPFSSLNDYGISSPSIFLANIPLSNAHSSLSFDTFGTRFFRSNDIYTFKNVCLFVFSFVFSQKGKSNDNLSQLVSLLDVMFVKLVSFEFMEFFNFQGNRYYIFRIKFNILLSLIS